jgi:hypothetical protein
MTASERAVHVWPILALCASRRETLTYDLLGRLIGMRPQLLPELLEPIQSYCFLQGLAPLTSIVVSQTTGLPLIGESNVERAQAEVYAQDWLRDGPPEADLLRLASEGMLARRAREKQSRPVRASTFRRTPKPRVRTRKTL